MALGVLSRRSETVPQREHEQKIHDELSSDTSHVDDHLGDHGIKDKVHEFYEKVVKPAFPEAIQDFKIMKGMTALEHRIKREIVDETVFPEVAHIAKVRRGLDLCAAEEAFLARRKPRVREAFAIYLGLDVSEVHPDDVPVVSFGGSGGGFRAMIGFLGYCDAMKQSGLFDCLTYVAGVSGSCWSLAAYYTIGKSSMAAVIEHCKRRFHPYHPLSGEAIRAVLSAPGGAHSTLAPLVQKSHSGLKNVPMDLYAVFTTGHIFLQEGSDSKSGKEAKEVAGDQADWSRFTDVARYTDDGSEPLPILTAIRHERPWRDWQDEEHPFKDPDHSAGDHVDAPEAWFQWFEMTPYEIGCDEIQAWVPTWGFGRPYEQGSSTMQLPEQSLALLLGLCTSAPAGPLTSYISTISRNLPAGFLGTTIHSMAHNISKLWGKQGTEEFQNHHPLHACNEHNFMFHYTPIKEGESRPPGLENSPRIHLIDSGMDNNCPTYVLLHPSREADVIINMDASSDVQKDTFPERAEQIGSRKGLKFTRRHDLKPKEDVHDPDRFRGLYAQVYDGVPCERPDTVVDSYGRTVRNPPAPTYEKGDCTMIYMPILPNDGAVHDYDPSTAAFSGSYNLVWTPEQIDMLVKVSNANFRDGEATIKEALREAWQRKRSKRESANSANLHSAMEKLDTAGS